MSFGPQLVMPGAFHMEAPNGAAPLGGAHAGIFRPPNSPSISNSLYLGKSTGSFYADVSTPTFNVKRKRQEMRTSTPSGNHGSVNSDSAMGGRPRPGRRISSGRGIRYTLAGSLETPNGAEQKQLADMDDSTYSDVDYRRALGSRRTQGDFDSSPTRPSIPPPAPGWSQIALSTIGGVVGKVWEFCKEGAFRGFYAGGGRSYDITTAPSQSKAWCNEHDIPTLSEIPGGFPKTDDPPFQCERATPDSTPPPAAKRRQISDSTPNDELRRNWVMVTDPVDNKRQPGLPVHEQKVPQARPSLNRRISKPVSRLNNSSLALATSNVVSHAGSASLNNRQAASFASPRSPVVHDRPATPSRLPVPSRPRSSSTVSPKILQQPSQLTSPSPYAPRGHRRAHSTASATSSTPARMKRRGSSAQELIEGRSPRLDAKAKNMIVRKMKQDQEADARINDFNTRLMDMIRQGKEALGTTIEVDGYDDMDIGGNDHWEDD
ncbi:hypothetical protein SCUP515_12716 [Seiridium cupressi]